ncbi:MAG: response regulator [Deltaproteobacteria bacterium]|jgi:DNA-binding response OmpR family regulator|nr:response regulator [Deltaproteobacteria bacterium]
MSNRSTILIVDDEPVNIQILTGALKSEYNIIKAFNGCDAIALVKEHHPDLVVLDVMMPCLDGFEVCRIIKSDEAFVDTPVIFLTGMDTPEGEIQGLGLGGIDYLAKPVNLDLLRLRVRNYIELKKRSDLVREQRDLLARKNEELEAVLARVKQLEGVIPICMHCKSIRNDSDSWQQLEAYISDHTDALFSHGICPTCLAQYYPGVAEKIAGDKLC